MEKTIKIPEGVSASIDNWRVSIKGKRGTLDRNFYSSLFSKKVSLGLEGNVFTVKTGEKKRPVKAFVGAIASHVENMVLGVQSGYEYRMKIIYMHFPMTVKVQGKEVVVSNFLGEKSPRKAEIKGDNIVEVKGDEIILTGINKEDVGQTANLIERATWIKARDRRVYQDGCFIISGGVAK